MHKNNVLQFWCFRKSFSWLQTWHLATHSLPGFNCNFKLKSNCTFEKNTSHLQGWSSGRQEVLLSSRLVPKASACPSHVSFPFVLFSFQNTYSWPREEQEEIYIFNVQEQVVHNHCLLGIKTLPYRRPRQCGAKQLGFNTENPQERWWARCLCRWAADVLMGNEEVLLPSGREWQQFPHIW